MFLKTDRIEIDLGGMPIQSHNVDLPQLVLDPTAIRGWYDGVGIRRESTERLSGWGDFIERAQLSSRLITLSGTAVGRNASELQAMRDVFMGHLALGEYHWMSLYSPSMGTRYVYVAVSEAPTWVRQYDTFATWRIELYAPDPRIYSELKSFDITDRDYTGGIRYQLSYPMDYGKAGQFDLFVALNQGNADAWPEFSVEGNFPDGFVISDNNTRRIVYRGMVTQGAPVLIDSRKGTATQGGIDRSTSLVQRDWFAFKAQTPIQPVFDPIQSGAGWCTVRYRDTWI